MPGVYRAYTAADIIGTLQDGVTAAADQGSATSGTGNITEADETLGVTDAAFVQGQGNPPWNGGQWGSVNWG